MNIINRLNYINTPSDLASVLKLALDGFGQELNCVRVGIVQEFIPEQQIVRVKIASQRLINVAKDGSQVTSDYAEIYAKLCYASPYIVFPPAIGDECILLFNDREMESWWVNGSANQRAYNRMHDLTDCIAVCGLRSQPKLIELPTDAIKIFYGENSFILQSNDDGNSATINTSDCVINTTDFTVNSDSSTFNTSTFDIVAGDSTINAQTGSITLTATNIALNGIVSANHIDVTDGASGSFISQDSKVVTVVNGIITSISQ